MNEFESIVTARHSKRAFLPRPVGRELLEEVLLAAANAPSSRNTQPWRVTVVTGSARERLERELCNAFDHGVAAAPDYLNNPAELDGVFAARAAACAAATFETKGIDRNDPEARRAHLRDNLRFFGAPAEMIFHLPGGSVPGSFLALGCFLQNVMLGLVARGLGSCPQYSVAGYGGVIRRELLLPADEVVVCGLAVGHPDPQAPINSLVPERAPLAEFVDWLE